MTKSTKIALAAVAGIVAGMLLAPKSGEETRRGLKQKVLRARGYANAKKAQAREAVDEVGDTFRESAARTAREMIDMADSVRGSASKVLLEADHLGGEAKTRASRVVKDNRRTADQTKKTAKKVFAP